MSTVIDLYQRPNGGNYIIGYTGEQHVVFANTPTRLTIRDLDVVILAEHVSLIDIEQSARALVHEGYTLGLTLMALVNLTNELGPPVAQPGGIL